MTGSSSPETEESEPRRRRRGIYLLPNLITTGALFSGFYAIVAGMNGNFIPAGLAIFVAMALDTADGRVARWTRTESAFGAEFDSLSDMVAFGVAPALVAFSWGLVGLGKIGWMITFVFMACAALRLARYNTSGDNDSFTGLASPSAAGMVACLVWVLTEDWYNAAAGWPVYLVAAVTLVAGLLMVSPFEYYSPKNVNLKSRVSFVTLVAVVMVFAVLSADPPRVLLFLFSAYALSGPLMAAWRWRQRRHRDAVLAPAAQDSQPRPPDPDGR
jgi:CDP-diacylglycerol--serine O-phosphatidyltransferase